MSRERLCAVVMAAWTVAALACPSDSVLAQEMPAETPAVQAPPSSAAPAQESASPAPPEAVGTTPAAPPPEPSLEAKERARVAYARGQAAFAGGDYLQAKRAFEEAFEAVPNPIVLLSVAESAAKVGLIDDAIANIDHYLQLRPDAPDHAQIVERRAALVALPAHLVVTSDPSGAEIALDGQPTGKKAPSEFEVAPGDHQLQATLPGYEGDPISIHAAAGSRLDQQLVLRVLPPPPAASAPAVALQPARPLPVEAPAAALWVTGSLGAAGLIAGTVLGFLALKAHSDFDSKPTEAAADRGERLALFSDVGFGVGAMAAITAAVLYLTHDEVPAPAPAQARRRPPTLASSVEFLPKLSASSASASARIRF